MNIKDLWLKRVLIVTYHAAIGKRYAHEYNVDEISPTGEWVKVSNNDGSKWISSEEVLNCEVLGDSTRL